MSEPARTERYIGTLTMLRDGLATFESAEAQRARVRAIDSMLGNSALGPRARAGLEQSREDALALIEAATRHG